MVVRAELMVDQFEIYRGFNIRAFESSPVMDFPSFVKADLPQRLVSSLWQVNARVLDAQSRAAA